jgi:ABC-type multidrug transport system ATPase subunit
MQDDAFIETLTVHETLFFSLCLRVPSKFRNPEIIEEILDVLNIRKVRDVQIGDPLKR